MDSYFLALAQAKFMRQRTTAEIIKNCQEEATLDRTLERGDCFELFRRALDEKDEAAWEGIQAQYFGLIQNWIATVDTSSITPEQKADLEQEVLHKFWATLTIESNIVETRFAHIGGLLKYLRQCATRAVYTLQRQQQKEQRMQEKLQKLHQFHVVKHTTLEDAETEEAHQRRLQTLRMLLDNKVQDPVEKRLLKLYFEQGLKPAEIAASYPQEFPTIQSVYRMKERILKRLRRAIV